MKKAPRMGSRVEKQIRDRRGYRVPDSGRPWRDAIDPRDGTPVEIKAAVRERESGRPGRFRVFRQPHEQLQQADGRYEFVVYRVRGSGAEILGIERKAARAVRISNWNRSGHSTDGRELQKRIPIKEVFG